MCICINCKFYSTCWINYALINFPRYYQILGEKLRSFEKTPQTIEIYLPFMLEIQLNINSKNRRREPDIIFCDAFIDEPGYWISNY